MFRQTHRRKDFALLKCRKEWNLRTYCCSTLDFCFLIFFLLKFSILRMAFFSFVYFPSFESLLDLLSVFRDAVCRSKSSTAFMRLYENIKNWFRSYGSHCKQRGFSTKSHVCLFWSQ